MIPLKPCLSCGTPCENGRCTDCATENRKQYGNKRTGTATQRGYDRRWRLLSEKARRIQPWCSDCGSDKNLTADHSEEAWRRYNDGLPIRLKDVSVVCLPCNIDRGSSRPGEGRSTGGGATLAGQAKSASIASDSH